MKLPIYKSISLCAAIVFSIVGLAMLFLNAAILEFFNTIAGTLGMQQSSIIGANFYVILSTGYMYLVSLLAFQMYRHPQQSVYPFLLMNGKLASSTLSIGMFFLSQPLLIYVVNGVVDGLIGLLVFVMYRSVGERPS
jgi:hypothetical protein